MARGDQTCLVNLESPRCPENKPNNVSRTSPHARDKALGPGFGDYQKSGWLGF